MNTNTWTENEREACKIMAVSFFSSFIQPTLTGVAKECAVGLHSYRGPFVCQTFVPLLQRSRANSRKSTEPHASMWHLLTCSCRRYLLESFYKELAAVLLRVVRRGCGKTVVEGKRGQISGSATDERTFMGHQREHWKEPVTNMKKSLKLKKIKPCWWCHNWGF